MLLVLDNCEQAVRAVSTRAADLLSSAPGLHLLATSRVELGVKGEYRVTVDPLAVPATDSDPGEIATADAVDLYLQRHRVVIGRDAVDADLASIGELTRRLDGLPLAIELAAGRSQILTPAEISERLSEHPRVLGAPDTTAAREDHQTMSDTIRWSYDLLEPATAHVFDLLSVMPDAFGVETAEAVCGAGGLDHGTIVDHLAQLQQASMVTSEPTAEGQRFRILLLLRQFGADRLAERGETERARRAHADHFRQMARRAASEIDGPDASRWWARVTVERTHMRSAVEWSLQHDDRTTTLEFAHLLARTQELTVSVDCHEAVDLFTSMLDGADAAPADHRGWAWLGIVTPAFLTGDSALAVEAATTSLALFDESADAGGRAMAHFDLAMALLLAIGDTAQAAELNATAAAEAHAAGSRAAEAWAISGQAQSMLFGNAPLEEIEPLLVRSEGLTDEGLPVLRAHNALNRAYFSYVAGDLERAATATRQARDDAARGGSPMLEQAGLLGVAAVALLGGDAERARAELLRAVQIAIDGSNTLQLGAASLALAGTLDTLGDLTAAARMWGAGTARSPVWPFIAERWFPHGARKTLGDRFQREVEIGTELTERQILDLAIG
jgi:predicted ATPase